MKPGKENMIISNIYRLPRYNNAACDLFIEQFNLLLDNLSTKGSEVFVNGDFNINSLELNTKEKVKFFFNDVTSFSSNL